MNARPHGEIGRKLLFLTPVVPRPRGSGIAMRASVFLRALSPLFDIHLHIIPLVDPWPSLRAWPELRSLVADMVIHPLPEVEESFLRIGSITDPIVRAAKRAAYPKPLLCRFETADTIARIRNRGGNGFDFVHVMRLYVVPFLPEATSTRGMRRRVTLDMDDLESLTHRRFSSLRAERGEAVLADFESHEARRYDALEAALLPDIDGVFLANDAERRALSTRGIANGSIVHIPNAIPEMRRIGDFSARRSGGDLRLLFVGTLNYFPNEDALEWFCDRVLPLLRSDFKAPPIRLTIVGAHPSPRVLRLRKIREVKIKANVADVTPFYRRADLVIAPVRTGGGSRIKVLEAMAQGRPVVATHPAVDGIEVRDCEHLLLADTPEGFAAACRSIRAEPELVEAMVERSRTLVASVHQIRTICDRIQDFYTT